MAQPTGAVLFDIDGTLVDSNYLHVAAWLQAFAEVGRSVDGARIHRAIGMGSSQLLDALLGTAADDLVREAVTQAHARHYRSTFPLLRPFAGAAELLHAVSARAATVLATSASPEELERLRQTLQVDTIVTAITSSQDVQQAKPEPDIVGVALERAGVGAERAVFVGDTVWDVIAAKRAGLSCVGLRSGGISTAELSDAGALAVYGDAAELLAHLSESPLARLFD